MAVTYGFYDSLNHDRLYNAQQMSAIFDGIINDGVFMSVGNQFHTVAGTGMQVIVKSGRAWFDSTWTLNDAEYPLSIDAADVLLTRIDAVVLEVNSEVATRANTIKVVKGTPASTPAKPTLTNTATIHQHALAYVTVTKNTTAITNSMIEIVVGKTETPYVTAILQTTDITDLYNQWEDYFQTWFDTVRGTLDGDVALNLQNQITSLRRETLKNTTPPIIGLPASATPDDMFQALAHTGDLYVWKKTEVITEPVPEIPPSFELGKTEELRITRRTTSNSNTSDYIKYAQWANEITVSNNGNVSLKNPTVGTDESNFLYGASSDLIGKYFMFTNSTVGMYCDILCPLNTIYYVPNDSEAKNTSGPYDYGSVSYFTKAQKVIGKAYTPAIPTGLKNTFPVSTNPNAYQEGGDAKPAGYVLGDVVTGNFKMGVSIYVATNDFYYVDTPNVSDDGVVSVPTENTSKISVGYKTDFDASTLNVLRGKFVMCIGNAHCDAIFYSVIYIPADATFTKSDWGNDGYTYYLNKYQPVTGYAAIPAGTTIEYLGKLGDKARVQVVSYVGTGTYGSSNPNSVTANFPIKLLAVLAKTLKNSNGNFSTRIDYDNQYKEDPFMVGAILTTNYTIGSGCGYKQKLSVYDTSYGKKSNDGKTFSWYTTGNHPAKQFNESGYTYIVLLIG